MREEMIIRKEFVLDIVNFMESQFAKAESDGEQALCCFIMEMIDSCINANKEE